MSIRTYNKDHLREHAGVTLAAPVRVDAPQSHDPLVFWTQHEKEPCEVNLHPFAMGQEKSKHKQNGGKKFIPFTGRPELISQLTPAIEEAVLYAPKSTVNSYMNALRDWWRVLDAVEAAAAMAGQPMTRVEDVRLLTHVQSEFAHRTGLSRTKFGIFRLLVDTTRMALGVGQTYWESPEDPDTQKHIPKQEQRDALRFTVRGICRSVMERWTQSDRLSQSDEMPLDPHEAILWRNVRYMRNIQMKTGNALPKPDDLFDDIAQWALNTNGSFKMCLQESVFPSHQDANAVWHQCLLNTGWNSSTLTSLDATKKFLFDHFKDDPNDPHRRFVLSAETYKLVGEKERAGGKEQFVTGQWKTQDGPGHLIKTYLDRVEPLRKVLKQQLAQEQLKYEEMKDADYEERTAQFGKVKTLERGVRSVWLYVDRSRKIGWISSGKERKASASGKPSTFLDEVVRVLNTQSDTDLAKANARRSKVNTRLTAINARRGQRGRKSFTLLAPLAPLPPIPHVAAKDFRVWFADYVYRSANGNMLHVQRALNHARLDTTVGYTNTNILNQEASDSARRFLNILVGELEVGRGYTNGRAYKPSHALAGKEREWPMPEFMVDVFAQQVKLVESCERLARMLADSADMANLLGDSTHLWAALGTSGSADATEKLVTYGKNLQLLAVRVGLTPKPGGKNLHPHRFRKTLARLAGLAIDGSQKVLMLLLGHDDVTTTLGYMQSDRAFAKEVDDIRNSSDTTTSAQSGAPVPKYGRF